MNTDCENEGYVKTCPSGQVKDGNRKCPYNNAYFKCRDADNSCDAGSSTTECSDTQVAVSSYQNEAENTCYQCRDKTCSEGGYTDSLTSCQKGSTVSFANKTCYQNVTEKTCEDMGYQSSIPTNNKCDSTTYCSKTCYTNCKQPTCEDGNYKSGVPTNQVCTLVSYYGRTCYKDCYQPQCSAGGYLDACPTDQSGTPLLTTDGTVSKIALTMKLKSPANVVLFFTKIKKCYSSTTKTPIAVVFDTEAKRVIALNEVTNGSLLDIMAAGYASSYAPAGVRGWQYPLDRDLSNLKDIQDTLNTALESIGATPINGCYVSATPYSYPLTEPTKPYTSKSFYIDISYKIINLQLNSGSMSFGCINFVSGYSSNASVYFPIRLVLPYGDGNCGAYKFNITSSELCDYEILNGNLCYKDCVTPTCGQGGFFTSCNSEWESKQVPFYGNTCYRCTFDGTCEDGGYYTKIQDDMFCLCNIDGTGTITYQGLNCYECTEKPNIGGGNGGTTSTTCEDLGYLTPGSTAACACTYGTKGETATTSSGSTLSCVRCGTYAECGGSTTQCIKCATSRG